VEPFVPLFADGPPLALSVLGQGADSYEGLQATLHSDLYTLDSFLRRHAGRVTADILDLRLPADLALETPDAIGLLTEAPGTCSVPLTQVFLEVPLDADWPVVVPEVAAALKARNDDHERRGDLGRGAVRAGFKLRCGGLDAAAFPSPDQVAVVLKVCHQAGVSLKFTAGLHHPLRRPDPATGATMHGFVNVFAAAALEWSHGLEAVTLAELLADNDPASFSFDSDALRWRDLRVSRSAIELARQDFATSFGSCSFDEPREDLRALGWMEAEPR
jgi:hypothetical protein